jgi:hypothetical protein
MEKKYKITCLEQYDLLISAELPNKKKYPELYKMVMKYMMHGPYGVLNHNCSCTKSHDSYKDRYPSLFVMPQYRARIHTQFIDGVKMGEKKRFVDTNLTTDGSCLTTHISFDCSTAISMLRHVGASRQSSTYLSTYTRVMTERLWL